LYRARFGYRIGRNVRIGLTFLDAADVDLGEGTRIGHLNLITRVGQLVTGREIRIGALNITRGGERVSLGDYSTVMRLNVLNAIPDHDCTTSPVSTLELAAGAVVVSGHRIDFTDRVTVGRNVVIGGQNSSLWTHNRHQTAPIAIGDFCYIGSEVRLAPGAVLAERCILWIGSVLTGRIAIPGSVVVASRQGSSGRSPRRTRRSMLLPRVRRPMRAGASTCRFEAKLR
jgi:UDP-3-O-[3-hydroxymyristoyl] glucosamine N-acyltransferase